MCRRLPVGFVLISSIPARAALLGPCVWEGSAGMRNRAGVMGGQGTACRESPTSFLTAKRIHPWGRASSPAITTSLPSRANIPPAPVSGGILGYPRLCRHHLVKVCTFEALCPGFAGRGDVCPEFGETEAETADKVCLELRKKPRVKYINNLPQLPPAPTPHAPAPSCWRS